MYLVPFLLIIPLGLAFLIALIGKKINAADSFLTAIGTSSLAVISYMIAFSVLANKILVYKTGNWISSAGIPMVVDALAAFMLVTVNTIIFLIALYSIDYVKKYTDQWKFYTLFMLMVGGINGVLVTGDIFNLYVFLEITAISGYFLVAFGTSADEFEASFKYAVMGTVASIFILLGIALLYSYTNTLNMADMANVLASKGPSKIIQFVAVLFLMGLGLKAALAPFHAWLPYAHSSAPAPVSAMLSGVVVKVSGVYALSRIFFNVFGMTAQISTVLIILGVLSMIVASLLAFGQSDIKRLFAYSSISQIGYIVLALGIATPLSIFGALFHLLNHSLFKALLFLNSGAIERTTGTRDLNKIRGVLSNTPVVGYTGITGALSICGMPPLGGFWSKLIIILACIQANRPVLGFIAISVSMLTLAYYFKALTPAMFGQAGKMAVNGAQKKVTLAMSIPMVILAVLSIVSVMMLLPNSGNALLNNAVSVLYGGRDYAAIVFGANK